VRQLLELGVGGVFADAAQGPADTLGAAVRDARGDQGVHCRAICGMIVRAVTSCSGIGGDPGPVVLLDEHLVRGGLQVGADRGNIGGTGS